MEPVGLVVGVAGLFSVCMDILDRTHSFNEAGKEQRQVYARFQAEKIRLKEWGDGVGVSGGELKDPHDGRLDDSGKREAIRKILLCIGEALGAKTEILSKVRADFQDENPYSVFGAGNELDGKSGSKKISMPQSKRRTALAWSMSRKRRSKDDIDNFKALVDGLYSLVPLNDGPSSSSAKRATGLEDHNRSKSTHPRNGCR